MKNKIIYVSGVVNFETIVDVDSFPIFYCPIEYPFFGVNSGISGQAYNVAKALKTLGGNDVVLSGLVGKDLLGDVIINQIKKLKIDTSLIKTSLETTPNSISLVDRDNNVKTYMDLKEIQEICRNIALGLFAELGYLLLHTLLHHQQTQHIYQSPLLFHLNRQIEYRPSEFSLQTGRHPLKYENCRF